MVRAEGGMAWGGCYQDLQRRGILTCTVRGSANVYMYHTFPDGHCDGAVSTADTISHQTLHPAYLSP